MTQQFATHGPVKAVVRIGSGEVVVEPAAVGAASAEVQPIDPEHEPSVRLAQQAEVRFERDRLVVVVSSQGRRFRQGHVRVSLALPESSSLAVGAGAVDVRVDGSLSALEVKMGSGSVLADHVGDAAVRTGSGRLDLGRTDGRVTVKGGAVDLIVREAASGDISFITGSGGARVDVVPGTTVELDLMSGSGDVRCDLSRESSAPTGGAGLRLRLKTGSGDLLVAPAAPANV